MLTSAGEGNSRRRGMAREVAESCIDSVNLELVHTYCSRLHPTKPDLAARRIEAIGFQVGLQLAERYTNKERPRFGDHLEAIKFICKDFWTEVFKKQVDNLKTNHRGVFVLQDNRFRWLVHVSLDSPSVYGPALESSTNAHAAKASQAAGQYLYFPCGLIRGALTNLGVTCAVSAEVSTLPACGFIYCPHQGLTWIGVSVAHGLVWSQCKIEQSRKNEKPLSSPSGSIIGKRLSMASWFISC